MNELVEKLLQPVSAEQPCGPDPSDRQEMDELERLLKGKPEVEIGTMKKAAKPPDWRQLKDRSLEVLHRSKHLRVSVILCCGWLQTNGVGGLRDGLQLIRGLLEQYWPVVYPLLAAEDGNDPTQRLNILGALNSPRGTLMPETQQWLAIIDYLYAAPLCRVKGGDVITLELVNAARRRTENKPTEGSEEASAKPGGPDLAQINKAIRAAPAAEVEASRTAVAEAAEALQGIDQFLMQTLGAGNTISFDELRSAIKDLEAVFQTSLPAAAAAPGGADDQGVPGVAGAVDGGGGGDIPVSGSIRSRDDVVRVLDAVCEYYRQIEPGSPVPLLLRRAQKIATMNFLESMQELSLATPETLRPIMGSVLDAPPADSGS